MKHLKEIALDLAARVTLTLAMACGAAAAALSIASVQAHAASATPTKYDIEQQAKHVQGPWYRGSEYIDSGACMPIDRTPAEDRHANDDAPMTDLVRAETAGGEYSIAYQYKTGQYEVYSTSDAACSKWMRGLVSQATQ
jgi:hypothetical protein